MAWMRVGRLATWGVFLGLLGGCSDEAISEPAPPPPAPRVKEEIPAPGPLTAGVAEVDIPVPLGIGTMGYGAFGEDPSVTPFADRFPGTVRQHGTLTLKAVALSRGDAHEVIFVRADTIGIFQQLREAVLDELEERLGRDLDDALILAGNHTHSGPGRLLMATGPLVDLGDTFFPEVYDRVVNAFADVVEEAIADQAAAEVGWTMASSSDGHSDRRCENDPLDQIQENPELPLIAVRREGQIDAVVASYAYHGTVLGIDDLTLSGDMGAVVEQKIAEQFDHPVSVLFFNSFGGDMSPGPGEIPAEVTGAPQPGGYDKMEQLGVELAAAMMPVIEGVSYETDLEVRARTYRTVLNRDVLGYAEDEWNYPNGGVFCGLGGEGNCDTIEKNGFLDKACLSFPADEPAPQQTVLTAGQIGDLSFVTGPGEWTTALAHSVLEDMRERSGFEAMFIGYAQDYTGYSLGETDWWQGGYESSGSIWGPRQGDYLAAQARDAAATYFDQYVTPTFEEPEPLAPFGGYSYEPYVPETGVDPGTIAVDAPATVAATDVLTVTVRGSDPWRGTPLAVLERDDGEGFAPVMRPNGTVVDSRSYDMWIDLAVSPSYAAEPNASARTFSWTFHVPVSRRAATTIPQLDAPHRLAITVPTANGDLTVTTAAFTVE